MTGLAITLTNAGLAALTAAKGSNAITIAGVGLTAASFTPTADATSLPDQIKTLSTFSGEVADDTTVHLSVRDESADDYELRGFGLYLSDGTLFGVYGNGDTLIMEKAAASILLLAIDIRFSESDATAITFGDTNFTDPPATTERQGVVELATETEGATGTDATRAVTPRGMLTAVTGWLNARFGTGAPSSFVKGLLTSASASVLRTALELKSAALQEASTFAAAVHTHTIAQVTGLQTTLDAKLAAAGYTAADVLTKLVSVDGAGSGLDADTVDGYQASYFLKKNEPVVSTGSLDTCIVAGSYRLQSGLTNLPANAEWSHMLVLTGGDTITQIVFGRNKQSVWFRTGAGDLSDASTLVWLDWATLWTSGNDGAGSGLDADTVDGKEAAAFASASHTHTIANVTGLQTALDAKLASAGYTAADVLAKLKTVGGSGSGVDADLLDGQQASAFAAASHTHTIAQITSLQSALDAKLASTTAHVTSSKNSASAGYRIWSDGFIECWGTATVAGNGKTTVTFPVSFASWAHAMVNGGKEDTDAKDNGPWVQSRTLTNMVIHNAIDDSTAIQWRAWGY